MSIHVAYAKRGGDARPANKNRRKQRVCVVYTGIKNADQRCIRIRRFNQANVCNIDLQQRTNVDINLRR